MTKSIRKTFAAACVLALLGASSAQATTATGSFQVTATVLGTCTISGVTLGFGNYDPTSGTDTDGQTQLTVTCTKGTIVSSVQLDNGANASSGQRRMKQGASNYLNYNLFSDSGRTTAWNTTGSPAGFTSAGPSTPNTLQVYGRIPATQDVISGAYSDTVVATVNF
ncbi:MAG: spore coat protein U domain-containing protein [Deltaproteobacteria bacterium]|nr:spore coat protein U domain-containing protein [Deltaproteobacteria bacterium]